MALAMLVCADEKEKKPVNLKSSLRVWNTRSAMAFSFGSPLSAMLGLSDINIGSQARGAAPNFCIA